MKVIGFLFKLLIAVLVVLLILQAEYKGRKLKTYATEYFKSMFASSDTEMEETAPTDDALKPVEKKDNKKAEPVKQEVKEPKKEVKAKVKKEKSDAIDIPDEDRAQLQDLLEKEKGK